MKPRAVAIIIDHSNHSVLLIHRWREGREYYVLPGGKIEEGETPAQACVREAREETGLKIALGPQVAVLFNLDRTEYYFLAAGFKGKLELGFPEKGWQSVENVYQLEWVSIERFDATPLMPEAIRARVRQHLAEPQNRAPCEDDDHPTGL